VRLEQEVTSRPPVFWDLLASADALKRAEGWKQLQEAATVAHGAEAEKLLEESEIGREYRAELARLGRPQPESLVGIDLVEELLRLLEAQAEEHEAKDLRSMFG
jgi:hypothetical protein